MFVPFFLNLKFRNHSFLWSLIGPTSLETLHTGKAYKAETPWHKLVLVSPTHLLLSHLPEEQGIY